ncbi:MAG: ArnT family glycosyltransferase [Candidatus Brocadiia bacterium]
MRAPGHLSWALPLAIGATLLSLDITEPWIGSFDANGAIFSTAARNTLRYGLAATRGGQVVNAGRVSPGDFHFYTHHPPGLPLTMAASFALFGVAEWSARLVPILFALGAVALLHRVARTLAGRRAACLAALVFVLQPMVAFYGRMPDHEAPAVFFALALAALYLAWQERGGRWRLAALAVVAFVGLWYAWAVFLVPWLLLAHAVVTRRRGAWRLLVPAAAAGLGAACVLAHAAWLEGGLGHLWDAFSHRVGSRASDRGGPGRFGLWDFARRQGAYFWVAFSVAALAPCAAWLLGVGRAAGRGTLLVAALAAFGLLHVAIFKQGAYVHLYYQFYLAIPLALAAGLALDGLLARAGREPLWGAAALVLLAAIAAEGAWKLARIHRATDYQAQMLLVPHVLATTEPSERVLLVWDHRASFRQLAFYADRNLEVVPDRATAARRQAADGFTRLLVVRRGTDGELRVEPEPLRREGR